jgi:PIN domain nuclease of toxin-antitoxin system
MFINITLVLMKIIFNYTFLWLITNHRTSSTVNDGMYTIHTQYKDNMVSKISVWALKVSMS